MKREFDPHTRSDPTRQPKMIAPIPARVDKGAAWRGACSHRAGIFLPGPQPRTSRQEARQAFACRSCDLDQSGFAHSLAGAARQARHNSRNVIRHNACAPRMHSLDKRPNLRTAAFSDASRQDSAFTLAMPACRFEHETAGAFGVVRVCAGRATGRIQAAVVAIGLDRPPAMGVRDSIRLAQC